MHNVGAVSRNVEGPAGFGMRLRRLREARKETRTQLAQALRVSMHTVQDWESHGNYPSYWNLIEIARHFHISLTRLVDYHPHLEKHHDDAAQRKTPRGPKLVDAPWEPHHKAVAVG